MGSTLFSYLTVKDGIIAHFKVKKKKWLPISYFLISLILAALPDNPRK